ncbi:hypothetical protein F3J34_11320 [Klebsiella sp. Ap-873]|nr:hypothetical protein [Klebsiella sp. Ap-873]
MWDIVACVIATLAMLWAIYRDRSSDNSELIERIHDLETNVSGHSSKLDRLEQETDELETTIRNLEKQIHQMDLKIERILVILENK